MLSDVLPSISAEIPAVAEDGANDHRIARHSASTGCLRRHSAPPAAAVVVCMTKTFNKKSHIHCMILMRTAGTETFEINNTHGSAARSLTFGRPRRHGIIIRPRCVLAVQSCYRQLGACAAEIRRDSQHRFRMNFCVNSCGLSLRCFSEQCPWDAAPFRWRSSAGHCFVRGVAVNLMGTTAHSSALPVG